MPNKKAGLTKGIILRQLGRLGPLRPVAFRPPSREEFSFIENGLHVGSYVTRIHCRGVPSFLLSRRTMTALDSPVYTFVLL